MRKIEDTDYVQFCGGARPDWETLGLIPGTGETRITANVGLFADQTFVKESVLMILPDVQELRGIINSKPVRILDVRPKTEFGICHLPCSIRTFHPTHTALKRFWSINQQMFRFTT